MAATPQHTAVSTYHLTLNGVALGFVRSATGGDATADVVVEKPKPGTPPKKHLAGVRYDDIAVVCGLDLDKALYEWIKQSWAQNYARKDGSITTADYSFVAKSELEFFHALVTETGFPALDGSSKDAAAMTVKLAPEYTRAVKASGKLTTTPPKAQKKWLASNFRFELGGLETKRVLRIEPFAVKQQPATDAIGEVRDFQKEPTSIEFPNLRVTLAQADSQSWVEWHEDFVVKGNCGDDREKEGAIVFLAPDLKTELGRVVLHHVGIFGLRKAPQKAAEQVARLVADLYCEQMELHVGPAAARPAPRPGRQVVPAG